MSKTTRFERLSCWLPARAVRVLAAGASIGTLVLLCPWHAQADGAGTGAETTYHVVMLDAGDILVDIGADSHLSPGDIVEIWRALKVKHPVTGRMLEDRFRIGSLKLSQVGVRLSLARPEGNLTRDARPGDIIVVRAAPAPTPAQPVETTASSTQRLPSVEPKEPPPDPEAVELTAIFDQLRGADPVARIRVYEDYVRARPSGRYAAVLYEEAQALRRLLARESSRTVAPQEPSIRSFAAPENVMEESPLSIGVEIQGPVTGALLHVRNAGEVAYQSQPMTPSGPGYYAAVVPADRIKAPRLQYFLEGIMPDGRAVALRASADRPEGADVEPVPRPMPPKRRNATFSLLTDYADYNRMRGNDYAWQTEGWFGLRYGQDVGVRAVRSGFGVFRGAGGTIEDLDVNGRAPRRIGLTYGYLEVEIGASDFVSLIARGVVGLRDEGTSGGGQGMIRLGNDWKTNLLLGGEFLGGVGLRGFTQLELNTFPNVPIILRSEVTNQPAGVSDESPRSADDGRTAAETSSDAGDVGARGIVQVGYRVVPSMVLSIRGSYQGRTIHHAGPGVGAGVTYQW